MHVQSLLRNNAMTIVYLRCCWLVAMSGYHLGSTATAMGSVWAMLGQANKRLSFRTGLGTDTKPPATGVVLGVDDW